LGHDFACINLSDNLKPFDLLARRVRLCAQADLAMAYYNTRSALRPDTFGRILGILREECAPHTLITFARAVSTPDQHIETVTLDMARDDMADMRTVVLVGNSATRTVGRVVYTPRKAL
jgi:precorrin-3B C17-methyltransferase